MSSEMAWRAASLTSAGAAKSGKPCERLTALCFRARRVISRMTDSVNCSAFAESVRRATWDMVESGRELIKPMLLGIQQKAQPQEKPKERPRRSAAAPFAGDRPCTLLAAAAGSGGRGRTAGPVNHPVDFGIAQDDLHVFASLREGNRFHELGNFLIIAFRAPGSDAVFAGVEGREGVFGSAGGTQQSGDIAHT